MKYVDIKTRHREELNNFPMFFALSKKQFSEGMEKLGTNNEKELVRIPGSGFVLKKDVPRLKALFKSHEEELSRLLERRDFLTNALIYELNNHEYMCTHDPQPALWALGLKLDSEMKNECFEAAKKEVLQQEC